MTTYSVSDAVAELTPILNKAPAGAVVGEWIATTLQAGSSSQSGGYQDAGGAYVPVATDDAGSAVSVIVGKLEAAPQGRFNKVIVRWTKSKIPFVKGRVTVETMLDEDIVPRAPDDPIYQAAASARRTFWGGLGEVAEEVAAERNDANVYNQTQWFGPHRRVLAIRAPDQALLATDGLSTPWAGVAERENGVGCELFMSFESAAFAGALADGWAELLLTLGDMVADGYRIADDVSRCGAILFCRLAEDFSPMTRIVLSRDPRHIPGLPFGTVPLIRVTPIMEAEIQGLDLEQSGDWASDAARQVLERRGIAF